MPARPVAQKVWDGSTSTGTGSVAYFGEGVSKFSVLVTNASTKAVAGTVQGSLGGSTGWSTLFTFSTANSTGTRLNTSTGSFVVDKLRMNLSTNPTTGIFEAYVGAV